MGTGPHPRFRSPGPLVLLVDDAEDDRRLYATCLMSAGFVVEEAVDGEHALFKAFAVLPDVIVMDIVMPQMSGLDATRTIRSHPRTAHVPVIVLTAHVTDTALADARSAGATHVLTKPCDPDKLLATIDSVLPERAATGEE